MVYFPLLRRCRVRCAVCSLPGVVLFRLLRGHVITGYASQDRSDLRGHSNGEGAINGVWPVASDPLHRGESSMTEVTLSATPKGNGFQATVAFAGGVSISSRETYPTRSEAITAAAFKLLDMPGRLEALDAEEQNTPAI